MCKIEYSLNISKAYTRATSEIPYFEVTWVYIFERRK
jgi:hypothetical protein